MPIYTDQAGRAVSIPVIPNRIISLVPSQTELLYYFGLHEQVVGITKFCIHPSEWFRNKTRVGGTKSVNFQTIASLQPDLIIGNKEENTKNDIETLAQSYPVWISDVNNLEDALSMIREIAGITGKTSMGNELVNAIQSRFSELIPRPGVDEHLITPRPIDPDLIPRRTIEPDLIPRPTKDNDLLPSHTKRIAYLIWQNPLIAVGRDTFIDSMLAQCGCINIFQHQQRYPETSLETIHALQCDILMLSSEPFPFKEKHIAEMQLSLPGTRIILVDGEMFSWYGSRLLQSPGYFQKLINSLG